MVAQYSLELDSDRHPMMVRERTVELGFTEIRCPDDAARLLRDIFRAGQQAEEHVYMISLDTRKRILGVFDVCHGQISGCAVSPREVFLRALFSGASSVVIAHNHPSGDATPSDLDAQFTRQMKEAGEILGITLDDHLILGSGCAYYSFREAGQLEES